MKKTPLYWSLAVGLLAVVWQVVTFYVRFGRWNDLATVLDYVMFFLAGTLGGLILIFFLNRQATQTGWWVVLVVFLLATPIAMLMVLGGGMLGPLGVLIFPQIPWALFAWIGSMLGRFFSRG